MPLFNKWYWETRNPQAKVRSYLTPPTKMNSRSIKEVKHKSWSYKPHRRKPRGKASWHWMSWSLLGASLVAQMVKNLPTWRETQVQSLDWEDPLEKGMAIHSSILAWRIPWTEELGGLQSKGSQRVRHKWATFTFTLFKSRIYKELIQLNNSKFLDEQRTRTDISPKKIYYTNGQ